MQRLHSHVITTSDAFRENRAHNLKLAEQLRERLNDARFKRPQRAFDLLAERNKLTVRARLDLLLDPGTPFLRRARRDKAAEPPTSGVWARHPDTRKSE